MQKVERCRANAEAMVKVRNIFRVNLQLLKLQLPLRRSYLHLNLACVDNSHYYNRNSSKKEETSYLFLASFS